jgi:hypothetical protein
MPDFKIRTASSGWVSPVNITSNAALDYYVEQQAKLQASDASNIDWLGFSVSLSSDGNTAIVGGRGEDTSPNTGNGAAYIFTRYSSGGVLTSTWTEQAKLLASDAASNDEFGFSVALSGDGNTAIVGAVNEDTSPTSNNGAVYVYTKSGTTWTEQAKLIASDLATDDTFGGSISLSADGNIAIIGAYAESTSPNSNNGAAYVFTRSGSTWTEQAKLLASDASAFDQFGFSVAISSDGTTAIVGAPFEDTGAATNQGAAYVFTRSGSTWTQQQKLLASDAATGDTFGNSVSISADGNTVLIGAYQEDTSFSNQGAAYVFTRSGSTWTLQQKFFANEQEAGDFFGWSVAISGDGNTAIIGAYLQDTLATDQGAAYVFTRSSGSSWFQKQKLVESIPFTNDWFGWSVAVSSDGNTLLIGAQGDDGPGGGSQGAAFVFNSVPKSTPRQVNTISVKSGETWITAWAPPPAAPTLTVTNVNAYTNSMTWNEPSSILAITGYTLEKSTDNINWVDTGYTGSIRSFTITGLAANTTHYYRVSARNVYVSGPFSTTISQTTRVATLKRSTFTSSGTWTKPIGVTSLETLIVGGGGGGGSAGYFYDNFGFTKPRGVFANGGGGGGATVPLSIGSLTTSETSNAVSIGGGGAAASVGGDSSFLGYTAKGGGATGFNGGSGVGGSSNVVWTGSYSFQTNPGGAPLNPLYGGTGTTGSASVTSNVATVYGGAGGSLGGGMIGYLSSISGTPTRYGKGGSGATSINGISPSFPADGYGGGGQGARLTSPANTTTISTSFTANGESGNAGVVIVTWFD